MTIPPPPNPFHPDPAEPAGDGQDTLPEILGGFPRHLTTQLIDEEGVSRVYRERIGAWVLGLALALVSLAFPQERLIGAAFGEVFEASAFWPLWQRAHQFVGDLIGLRAEQARFLSSALCYGACVPAALGLGRKLGCPFGYALLATAVALFSPTAWLAGTTPGMDAAALLLLLLLMGELWRSCGASLWRCLVVWGLLVGLQESMALLFPALLVACTHSIEDSAKRKRARLIWLLGGVGVAALVAAIHVADWDPMPMPSVLDLDGSRFEFDGRWWLRLLGSLPGIGALALGLLSLWTLKRNESEQSPPRWLALWTFLPAIALLANSSLGWDASYQWLVPVALVGTFDLLARWESDASPMLSLGALLTQVALLSGFLHFVESTDPQRAWREHARQFLEEGDVVITGHAEHSYLVSHRWGQMSVVLRAADPENPDPNLVEGVYSDQLGQTNLRVKTQDFAAWSAEGLEAHGLGFRVILDRPFPQPSEGIAALIDEELARIVEFHTLRAPGLGDGPEIENEPDSAP